MSEDGDNGDGSQSGMGERPVRKADAMFVLHACRRGASAPEPASSSWRGSAAGDVYGASALVQHLVLRVEYSGGPALFRVAAQSHG